MKLTSLFIALFTVVAFSASAQPGKKAPTRTGNTQDQAVEQWSRNQTDRMAADLELTDEQRRTLYDQNSAHYLNQKSVHDGDLTDNERTKANEKLMNDYDNNVRKILNDAQYERYNRSRDKYAPDFRQDQRASPTREGTQSRQRHEE